MRIAHISDLHFAHITLNPGQFFSKRWIGNGNLLFNRRRKFTGESLEGLRACLDKLDVDLILVAGDLSCTGQKEEFEKAKAFFSGISQKILYIPGNHDHYTKRDYRKKLFYKFFENPRALSPRFPFETLTLQKDRMELRPLFANWWLLALDTALPTHIFSSQGLFSEELEKRLYEVLKQFPEGQNILLLNHFPFFPFDAQKKILVRGMDLCHLLKQFPSICLYVHGHTHRHCIADLREAGLPIILDSGSCAYTPRASFHLFDLDESSCKVTIFRYEQNWKETGFKIFSIP